MSPTTRYARSADVNIAYQVVGEGPLDLVLVPGWVSQVEAVWDEPTHEAFLRRLASFSRLILFDKRGTGLSDRVSLDRMPTLDDRMDDVRAVMDAAGSESAAVFGTSEGGVMSALFAATYPQRTTALILYGAYAKRIRTPDYPWAPTADEGDTEAILGEIEEFLTGVRRAAEFDRVLATVMFTDIADSTAIAADLGDSRWRALVESHNSLVRRELDLHRGREVDSAGDGFLIHFDGPARAIRCASAIVDGAARLGLGVRAGVHTGECEVAGGKLRGVAIHIGARVIASAAPGEVVVSSTVRDLVAGSGLQFADRGRHELKGVPGEWQLYAVVRAT